MKMQIIGIADRGRANKERLHLRATANTNLSFVVVFETLYSKVPAIFAGGRQAFWFPDRHVKMGDNVVLYSGSGTISEEKNLDGTTNYFYYWGLEKTIWHDPLSAAVVFDVLDWQTTASAATTPEPSASRLSDFAKSLGLDKLK